MAISTKPLTFLVLALGLGACDPPATTTEQQPPSQQEELSKAFPPFKAYGNEPGWDFELKGKQLTLITSYGERKIKASVLKETSHTNTRQITAEITEDIYPKEYIDYIAQLNTSYKVPAGEEKMIKIKIVEGTCADSMSDEGGKKNYSHQVEYTLNGKIAKGCGLY